MTDPDRNGFSRRHREGAERIRRKNQEALDTSNVVPLRRPTPKRGFRLPVMPFNALTLWTGIVAILVVVYAIRQAL